MFLINSLSAFFLCILFISVCFVPGKGFATSYWDSLLEIAYDPNVDLIDPLNGFITISRLLDLSRHLGQPSVLDQELGRKAEEMKKDLSTFDAVSLYTWLPFSDMLSTWNGIGISGTVTPESYSLAQFPPLFEQAKNSPTSKYSGKIESRRNLGDFDMQVFVRPEEKREDYRIFMETLFHLDSNTFVNISKIIERLLYITWLKDQARYTEDGVYKITGVRDQWLKDFPHSLQLLQKYIIINRTVTPKSPHSHDNARFNIQIHINTSAIEKDYPEMSTLLELTKLFESFQATIYSQQGQPLATANFNGKRQRFTFQLNIWKDGLLPLHQENPQFSQAWRFTDTELRQLKMSYSFRLNLLGLRLKVKSMVVNILYHYRKSELDMFAKLNELPVTIEMSGLVFYFLPVWLVDMVIPSNLETQTREFFMTLQRAWDGDGSSVSISSQSSENIGENVRLTTRTAIPDNGILSFAFKLQSKLKTRNDKLIKELETLVLTCREAFTKDLYQAITARGYSINNLQERASR